MENNGFNATPSDKQLRLGFRVTIAEDDLRVQLEVA
jgi:hypothetical protein